jgi:hypothetical protein
VADHSPRLYSLLAVALVATCVKSDSGSTDTGTVARRSPAAAVTVVSPTETPVTVPSALSTVAMAGSADDHSNATRVGRPMAS